MTTPLEAAYAELHRQLAPIGKLEEGDLYPPESRSPGHR